MREEKHLDVLRLKGSMSCLWRSEVIVSGLGI